MMRAVESVTTNAQHELLQRTLAEHPEAGSTFNLFDSLSGAESGTGFAEVISRDEDAVRSEELGDVAVDSTASRRLFADLGHADILVLDRESGKVIQGSASALLPGEIRAILDTESDRGDSTEFNFEHSFAWVQIPGSSQLLVSATKGDLANMGGGSQSVYITLILVICILTSIATARVVSGDIRNSMLHLHEHVKRIASGDFRTGTIYETEDDMGQLARGLQSMSNALSETISQVARTADRVEGVADDIVAASGQVTEDTEGIDRHIRDVTTAMETVGTQAEEIRDSAGELDGSVRQSSTSIGELAETARRLGESGDLLGSNIEKVRGAYETTSRQIGDVRIASEDLSNAADDTASAVDEMAAALRAVDTNATETAQLSEAAQQSAAEGQERVDATIKGIGSIRDDTNLVATLVRDLSERAEEIGTIVDVISNVADETNLLALNAAIIAAQAGDQGRSFSVVANEIKKLAHSVSSSTGEITNLIESVQDGAQQAVAAIDRSTKSVSIGAQLSAEAGESLDEITRSSDGSRNRMIHIVSAVREQTTAASHIVKLMSKMRDGIDAIDRIGRQQTENTEAVLGSTEAMRNAADLVQTTTANQSQSSASNLAQVREASSTVAQSLDQQSTAVTSALDLLGLLHLHANSSEESNEAMGLSARSLIEVAARLREDIGRFKIDEAS